MLKQILKFYFDIVTFGLYTSLCFQLDVANKEAEEYYGFLEEERRDRISKEKHLNRVMQENELLRFDKDSLTKETEVQADKINKLLLDNSELRAEIAQMKVDREKAKAFDVIKRELDTSGVDATVEKVRIYNQEIRSRKKLENSINLLQAIDKVKVAYKALNGSLYEERKGV